MTRMVVLGGTSIDSEFGRVALAGYDVQARPYSLAPTSEAYEVVLSQPATAENEVRRVLRRALTPEVDVVFAYCNSLASVVDFDRVGAEAGVTIVTPFDAYRRFFDANPNVECIGVLAGNGEGVAGITRQIGLRLPDASVVGASLLPLVQGIERGDAPGELISRYGLESLMDFFAAAGCEALILGCTHFVSLLEELRARSEVPIVDPTADMVEIGVGILRREGV